ncbi:MAG: ATP-binding protein [Fibrobacterota bacterium]|nr:ATP-binding protein [Fibrobacterota bacterium]
MKERYLSEIVKNLAFANHKMAFVSGPRQAGKTTFAKMLLKERGEGTYFNWDETEFRRAWTKHPKSTIPTSKKGGAPLVILDEIHKAKLWKRTLKGLFDTLEEPADLLVTGSARLNVYKKGSDSLLGRYFNFRLHPFTLREMVHGGAGASDSLFTALRERALAPRKACLEGFADLMRFGGFPEPLFAQDEKRARLWRRGRVEKVIREDLRDLSRIPELSRIEMLASLLPEKVGSMFSIASLREHLEVNHETVKRWVMLLQELYYLYEIKPYQGSVSRSLKKEGKVYLWDFSEVPEKAARFENLVAGHLLKACHFWTDTGEGDYSLHFIRNKEKQEVDFLVAKDGKPWMAVEAKWANGAPSPNWKKFLPPFGNIMAVQLIAEPGIWKWVKVGDKDLLIASAQEFLAYLV